MIHGNLGSGKTLFSVILAKIRKDSGQSVVANFAIEGIAEKFNMKTFLKAKYHDCFMILDEVYQYIDSRYSMSELNRFFSYILFQSRKLNIDLYIIAQEIDTIDKRFRELMQNFIACFQHEKGFYYVKRCVQTQKVSIAFLTHTKAEPFFPLYDTKAIVFDSKTAYKDCNEMLEESKRIAMELLNTYEKKVLNKSFINIYVLEHELDKKQTIMIYDYVKSLANSSAIIEPDENL